MKAIKSLTRATCQRSFFESSCFIHSVQSTSFDLGEGELKSAGWRRPSILADTFESIIGAIYLDGGIEPAHQFVLRFFENAIQ
jgi:hypothetical protein